jgi:hypothetical protein
MQNYDEVRRGLAVAMGWRVQTATGGAAPGQFTRNIVPVPDPLHSAEDAEALETP